MLTDYGNDIVTIYYFVAVLGPRTRFGICIIVEHRRIRIASPDFVHLELHVIIPTGTG